MTRKLLMTMMVYKKPSTKEERNSHIYQSPEGVCTIVAQASKKARFQESLRSVVGVIDREDDVYKRLHE